jgi:hypothetical protein
MGYNSPPPNTTVAQLIVKLQALPQNAYVRIERPNGWDNPIPTLVSGQSYEFPEGTLVSL